MVKILSIFVAFLENMNFKKDVRISNSKFDDIQIRIQSKSMKEW